MTDAQLRKSLEKWRAELAQRDQELGVTKRHVRWLTRERAHAAALIARRQTQLHHSSPDRLRCVHYALGFVGTVEQPPGSNMGPLVSQWQHLFGIDGQPWCGAFAGAMLKHFNVAVTNRVVYTPYIKEDALAGRNGFAQWIPASNASKAHGGDLVLYDFPPYSIIQHVGILRETPKNGLVKTIEGNTSFGNGSQDNGGAVAARARVIAGEVVGFARPAWAK